MIHVVYVEHDFATRADIFNGTKWHIDDDGHLHILGTEPGNIATFHRDSWKRVQISPAATSTDPVSPKP